MEPLDDATLAELERLLKRRDDAIAAHDDSLKGWRTEKPHGLFREEMECAIKALEDAQERFFPALLSAAREAQRLREVLDAISSSLLGLGEVLEMDCPEHAGTALTLHEEAVAALKGEADAT